MVEEGEDVCVVKEEIGVDMELKGVKEVVMEMEKAVELVVAVDGLVDVLQEIKQV